MTRLPDVGGDKVIKALNKNGWVIKSQKGSHIKLTNPRFAHFIIVASHGNDTIPKGTLSKIIKDAGLSREEFINLI